MNGVICIKVLRRGNGLDPINAFRYHPLFSDLLRRRLLQKETDHVPFLHSRANQWYEHAGLTGPAIHHALAAGNFAVGIRLIELTTDAFLMRGELRTFLSWPEWLPDESLPDHTRLRLYYATAQLTGGQPREPGRRDHRKGT